MLRLNKVCFSKTLFAYSSVAPGKLEKQCLLSLGHTYLKKSRMRETKNLSTDADRRTDTILERLRDLSTILEKAL